jgi:predicted dehydrogenase
MIDAEHHRANNGEAAGPVFDMAPYPVNAARNLFAAEPIEVSAFETRRAESGLGDLDDTVSVMLRFPGDRLAHSVVSCYGRYVHPARGQGCARGEARFHLWRGTGAGDHH